MAEASTLPADVADLAGMGFRTIDELAVRCGHYCWLENELFGRTGQWASAPAADTDPADPDSAANAGHAEIRVLSSQMSSWHGSLAGQWRDRLPVRAGVDVHALIVPPPGWVADALHLLDTVPDPVVRLGGLVDPILTGLLAAYDDEVTHASPVSEQPVLGVLELARVHGRRELEAAREAVDRELAARDAAAGSRSGPGTVILSDLRGRLQLLLGADYGIFPAARAS
jgi:hypothetical protein